MKGIVYARAEYENIVIEIETQKAIRVKLPPDTQFNLHACDKVSGLREKADRGRGPLKRQSIFVNIIYLTEGSKTVRLNVTELFPCFLKEETTV